MAVSIFYHWALLAPTVIIPGFDLPVDYEHYNIRNNFARHESGTIENGILTTRDEGGNPIRAGDPGWVQPNQDRMALFEITEAPAAVPDAGTTASLLGMAVLGLGSRRRKLFA